jgi:hypothetical protein
MTSDQLSTGFTRYRRFFIAVSLAMTFFTLLDLDLEKISLLGNEAAIRNPSRVVWIGWLIWVWAAIQYGLWFRDFDVWAQIRAAVRLDSKSRLQLLARTRPIPSWVTNGLTNQVNQTARDAGLEVRDFEIRVEGHREQDAIGLNVIVAVPMVATGNCRFPDQRGGYSTGRQTFEADVAPEEYRKCNRRAWLSVLFARRYGLEYLAPFVIGAMPILAGIWSLSRGPPISGTWI